ncbi:Gfo/Idh/MocA family oxidoreductase [Rothia sp. AR01]|uniref:Gfo/Idh/MocA family oxidoreductase n=1 Tax=Rothia santali TaxID=2949643 RepID=A0A9X2HBI7_9MICC|nr:Gfo/Idh/MocA family oxidoreductase [Rothia santali]MCP3424662.1 Gfo/Idh/MocA family oxidoreductase [Rothia santali]
MSRRLRTVLCGTGFGRFHREGIRLLPRDLELVGVLARGGEFSRAYAAAEGVPLYTRVEDLPDDVDLACVAIGSAVSGGPGAEIAGALLGRGIHVLQEHPVHRDELAGLLRAARAAGVVYRLNPFYRHVPAVRRFLDGAQRMRELGPILSVDGTSAVQVLHPLLDVLAEALGGTAPWALGDPLPADPRVEAACASPQPYRVLQGALAGVPLTLRVQHQLDPSDGDNHALVWHRIAITGEGGTLTLADAHGPVLWQPRLHAPRDRHGRLRSTGPGTGHLAEPALTVVPGTEPPSWRGIFAETWPLTMARAIRETVDAVRAGADPLPRGQRDLSVTAVWHDLLDRLGRPEVIRPAAPDSWSLDRVLPPTEEVPR